MPTKIIIGADHGGFALKEEIKRFLSKYYEVEDVGNFVYDTDDDYVDYAEKVARKVSKEDSLGILLCRSAAGMVIAANKIKGVRAVSSNDVKSAVHSREHNDANVLALSGDWLSAEDACDIAKAWIETKFSNEPRHIRRLEKIKRLEQ